MYKFGMVDVDQFKRLLQQFNNMQMDNGEISYSEDGVYFQYFPEETEAGGGGTTIKWAKVTAVTDANNYIVDIYTDRQSTASETSKALYVYDIVDQLTTNDWITVQSTTKAGKDYENASQLGAIG